MEYSSFEPPSSTPAGHLPPPETPLPTPLLPTPTLPSPEPAGATRPDPVVPTDTATPAHGVAATPAPAPPTTPRRTAARSRRGPVLVAAIVAVASIVALGVWLRSGDTTPTPLADAATAGAADAPGAPDAADATPAEAGATADQGDASIGRIGVDAIDDATALTEQLDDRSDAADLLAELGLDPDGNPLPVVSPIVSSSGYTFVWIEPGGTRIDVAVDTTSGNYALDGSDGTGVRVVDGVPYVGTGGSWSLGDLSALRAVPVPALDAFPTIDAVVDDRVAPFVRLTTTRAVAEGTAVSHLIDDSAFFAADPAGREAWLTPWGLLPGHRPPATADPAAFTEQWTDAVDGQVIVTFTVAPGGELVRIVVASPAIGGIGALQDVDVDAAPVIAAPPL